MGRLDVASIVGLTNCLFFLPFQAGQEVNAKDPLLAGPYVNSKAGVQPWGGWQEAAQKLFKDVREKAQTGRQRDHVEKMEQDSLDRLRLKKGIDRAQGGQDGVAQAGGKKTYDDSDDEFGDMLAG